MDATGDQLSRIVDGEKPFRLIGTITPNETITVAERIIDLNEFNDKLTHSPSVSQDDSTRQPIRLSVVTPVWNRADMTGSFLHQHYRQYGNRADIEFILVDNGSTDSTPLLLAYWTGEYKQIRAITNPHNTGYGPANNQGAAIAKGEYLAFVNNDVRVQGDWISPLLGILDANPGEVVGAQLFDYDTGWNVFNGKVISFLMGWCFAMHRDTWNHLGGFDEQFVPADYEDIDLCYRATQEGMRLIPARLPIQHIGRQTADKYLDRGSVTERNRVLFAKKWGFSLNGRAK